MGLGVLIALIVMFVFTGCQIHSHVSSLGDKNKHYHEGARRQIKKHWKNHSIYAHIQPVSESSFVSGWVRFEVLGLQKIQVKAKVKGLQPNSKVGFHIHQFGACGNRGMDAGGHLNPRGHAHGGADQNERHLGDLGNLKADAKGKAVYEGMIEGKMHILAGRSVIVHSQEDDLKSQPTGGAGSRVACGLLGVVKRVP